MFVDMLINGFMVLALHLDYNGMFPPPLKKEAEKECINKMKQGDVKAKEKLIEHNLRLVAHIIKKYGCSDGENEELISVGTVGLIKAINSFDNTKGVRLATYASRCIDNEILMHFRNQKKCALDISLDEPIETDAEGNPLTLIDIIATEDTIVDDITLSNNVKNLIKYVNEIENLRERELIILRFGLNGSEPKTQNEIAQIYGISRSYVSRLETKILKKLRKRFERELGQQY